MGRGLYLGLITASASASTGVFAQGALEEVVVSATRRAESIQDVPISVAAVSGDTIQDLGIMDMEQLSLLIPNFEINSASIAGWGVGGRLDISYSDDFYTDISYQDNVLTESFTLYNAVLRLVSPSENWTVSLIGKNLSNEDYCAWCIPSGPNILAAMNPPREIAIQVRARFD